MSVKCYCDDWKENFPKVNTPFEVPRSPFQYTGKPFEYCPWCSGKLVNTMFIAQPDNITISCNEIDGYFHVRLLDGELIADAMVCQDVRDVNYCSACMLRWYDKIGGADNQVDHFSNVNSQPIGKVWTTEQWNRKQ